MSTTSKVCGSSLLALQCTTLLDSFFAHGLLLCIRVLVTCFERHSNVQRSGVVAVHECPVYRILIFAGIVVMLICVRFSRTPRLRPTSYKIRPLTSMRTVPLRRMLGEASISVTALVFLLTYVSGSTLAHLHARSSSNVLHSFILAVSACTPLHLRSVNFTNYINELMNSSTIRTQINTTETRCVI